MSDRALEGPAGTCSPAGLPRLWSLLLGLLLLRPFWAGRARRAERLAELSEADALVWAWRQACIGAGIAREIPTVTGPTTSSPKLSHITLGPPTVLMVELLPGQLPRDIADAAYRLAPHLSALRLRVEPRGHHHVRVELLTRDPLADPVDVPPAHRSGKVLLARDERGRDERINPLWLPHMVLQGATRSGKSSWCYAFLAQLAGMSHVVIGGVDPSGLLLRPFAGTRHDAWQVRGLADPAAIVDKLAELVAEMDRRVLELPDDRDHISVSDERPIIVVVLEEWPATLRALDKRQADAARVLVARLLAESHKVGMRVLMVCQRADTTVMSGGERLNIGARLSFRVDNSEAVRMLHPDASAGDVDDLAGAAPGIGLLSLPGQPPARVRAPYLGDYRAFVAAVRSSGVSGDHPTVT